MENLLEKNKKFFFEKKVFFSRTNTLKKLVLALNNKKIAIVSGMRYSGKTKFVLDMIQKTWAKEHTFYFNAEVDTLGKVKHASDLHTLLDLHKKIESIPKIIILQNINKIQGIKDYIGTLYKEGIYKIIIVWNNIKIGGVTEVEVFPLSVKKLGYDKIGGYLRYGGIEEVQLVRDLYFKTFLLQSITEHIISQDIVHTYDIKSKNLYYQVIAFLAKINKNISLRELQRELEAEGISIALMTLTDYMDASVKSKIIKKVTKYDIKANKEIPTKITYYFGDTGVRNTLLGDIETPVISIINTLYNELEKKWYTVYNGVNGRFEMTFRAKKWEKILSIHMHETSDKNELKKDARKLAKLGDTSKKYLLVEEKEIYNMRKHRIDDVTIVNIEELMMCL